MTALAPLHDHGTPVELRRAWRRLVAPAVVGVAALAAGIQLFRVDPNLPGRYPLCPFHALTGLDCPGCGATRGMHDLLHGDLVGALSHNVLLLGAVPVALMAWFAWTRRSWTGEPRRLVVPPAAVYALLALVLAFWVVRNIPGVPFLGST